MRAHNTIVHVGGKIFCNQMYMLTYVSFHCEGWQNPVGCLWSILKQYSIDVTPPKPLSAFLRAMLIMLPRLVFNLRTFIMT